MSGGPAEDAVPRLAVLPIVERALAARPFDSADPHAGGGVRGLAAELALTSLTPGGWEKRLHAILGAKYPNRKGEVVAQEFINFDVVDRLLSGLELTHLWFGELAEYLPAVPPAPPDPAEVVVVASSCPRCKRKLNPEYEPAGTVAQYGHCALCVARLTTNRLTRGKGGRWPFVLLLGLYERYLLTGESDEYLLRAHGVEATGSTASSLTAHWRNLGWPVRTRPQSRRLSTKLHPKPPVLPKILRDRGGEPLVRQLHALHWHRRQSMNSMARELAPQWDVSVSRLSSAMSVAFSKLGLPAHDRIAMTVAASTTNGLSPRDHRKRSELRKAAGLTVHKAAPRQPLCGEFGHTVKNLGRNHGKPCTLPVLDGKTFCQSHDPERHAKTVEQLAQMRAVAHDPSKFVPLAPLQVELLDAAAMFGWAQLDRLYGGAKGHLSQIARGKSDRAGTGRIGKRRAHRIRVVIAQAKRDALLARAREAAAD